MRHIVTHAPHARNFSGDSIYMFRYASHVANVNGRVLRTLKIVLIGKFEN